MRLQLNKYCANGICNSIRQTVLTRLPCVRPIGFSIDGATVISINDSVEEDMTEFISSVSAGNFYCREDTDSIIECSVSVDGVLKLSDLCKANPNLVLIGEDRCVLHTLSPISVTVLFRYDSGTNSVADNTEFLSKNGFPNAIAICSRHSYVTAATFQLIETQGNDSIMELSVKSVLEEDGDVLIKQAISILKSDFMNL